MLAQGSQGSHVCGPICKSNSLVEASPAKSRHYCRNFPSPESQDSLSVQFSSLLSRGHPDEMGWEAKLAWPAEHEVGHSFSPSERDDRRRREVTLLFLAGRDDRHRREAALRARGAYSRERDNRRRREVTPLFLAKRDDRHRREATLRQGFGREEPGARAQPLRPRGVQQRAERPGRREATLLFPAERGDQAGGKPRCPPGNGALPDSTVGRGRRPSPPRASPRIISGIQRVPVCSSERDDQI